MIADTVATEVADSRHVVLDGVGHNPNLEAPTEFDRLCVEFLDRTLT